MNDGLPHPAAYRPPAGLLDGRVVFVTGATGAIGTALVEAAAAHGAQVIAAGRNVRALERLCDRVERAGHRAPRAVAINLEGAGVDDYEQLAQALCAEYGRLDGLVLNAAMLGELAPIGSYDPLLWARVVQVNLHSPFLMLRAFHPLLIAEPRPAGASVIMVSSSVGRRGRAFWGAYAVSKFALEGLAQVLAEELGAAGVRVNTLNPGPTRSRMRAQAYPAEHPAKVPPPAAVVPAFLYLLGDDSRQLNGQALDAQAPA